MTMMNRRFLQETCWAAYQDMKEHFDGVACFLVKNGSIIPSSEELYEQYLPIAHGMPEEASIGNEKMDRLHYMIMLNVHTGYKHMICIALAKENQ